MELPHSTTTLPIVPAAPAPIDTRRPARKRSGSLTVRALANQVTAGQAAAIEPSAVEPATPTKDEADRIPQTATEWGTWIKERVATIAPTVKPSIDVVDTSSPHTIIARGHGMRLTLDISPGGTLINLYSGEPINFTAIGFLLGGFLLEAHDRAERDLEWERKHRP